MIYLKRIVNLIHSSNTYILYNTKRKCWIIDVGDSDRIYDFIKKEGLIIKGILLTHTHYDHIYGLNLLETYHPGIPIYTSVNGKKSLYDAKLNLSKYHNADFVLSSSQVSELSDGNRLELFDDVNLYIMETLGHDWSCLTYKVGNYIFTGDSYIPHTKTVTTFPKSNKEASEHSISKIIAMIDDFSIICPGHGNIYNSRFTYLSETKSIYL